MSIAQAILLGIIQGITEFLPVSSSAHLVIAPWLLGWKLDEAVVFPFDVLVQLGTLLAAIIYFRCDLWEILQGVWSGLRQGKPFGNPAARLGWLLVLATIPAGLAGLFLKDAVEAVFNSAQITALFLLVTAALLLIAEKVGKKNREIDSLTWKDAVWIGVAQAFALFPGISRSGATITGGMTRHLDRKSAARFSFLMMIPVMLAAGLISVLDLLDIPNFVNYLSPIAAGFVVAAIVGFLAIHWLLGFLKSRPLYVFSIYCAVLAAVVLLVSYV
ncbi:undecaprenyl-diphosphatase UppP [bacterium]|nr:undecaprenyl-diphosphatase UppP [bacterium]